MSVTSCLLSHFGAKSPIAAYKADMAGDVQELVADGMTTDAAWLKVAGDKLAELKAERSRIEQVVADAYAKTPAGVRAAAAAAPAEAPARETIVPANDTSLGANAAGEPLYERKDGSRYRMHNGRPDFGGDLVPADAATHKDPGEPAEVATPAVVAEATAEEAAAAREPEHAPTEPEAQPVAQAEPAKANEAPQPAAMPPITGIPREAAQAAHAGTSHVPEQRALQEQQGFNATMADAWSRAARAAGQDQAAIDRITEVFKDVADGYRSRYMAALGARSRVMSQMIAGGGNFPVRRNEKRNETARKRSDEASEYLQRGIKRLLRAARGPIDNSPEAELERVRLNLTQREEDQEQMKAANVALRKGDDEALRDLGYTDEQIADLKKPDFAGRKGFPDYKLTNNTAEIRRLRERLKDAEARMAAAEAGPAESERQGVRMVEDATDDRLRLIFDGKPSEAVREDLKANGFKWSPKNEAWQRQLTDNARRAAKTVMDKHYPADEAGNTAMFSIADAPAQTETAAFKRWFGDSKVVDAEGKPLVVYHGTAWDFAEFDTTKSLGSWFSAKPLDASDYAGFSARLTRGEGANVKPVYLAIKNPAGGGDIDRAHSAVTRAGIAGPKRTAAVRADLEARGFDGIQDGPIWVAFRPEQIKSAIGNRGTFDPEKSDITLDAAGLDRRYAEPDTSAYEPAGNADTGAAERFAARLNTGQPRSNHVVLDAVAPRAGSTSRRGRELQAVATAAKRLFGHRVVFVKFQGRQLFNGAVDRMEPGVIFINTESQRPMMAVLGHELLHKLRGEREDLYRELVRRLGRVTKNQPDYYFDLEKKYKAFGREVPPEWLEELHADIVGDNFTDPQFWRDMAADQPGLFKRVAQAILKFLDDVAESLRGVRSFGTERYLTDIDAARAAVVSAMRQFSDNQTEPMADTVEGIRLSVSDASERKFLKALAMQEEYQSDPPGWFESRLSRVERQLDAMGIGAVMSRNGDPTRFFYGEDGEVAIDKLPVKAQPLARKYAAINDEYDAAEMGDSPRFFPFDMDPETESMPQSDRQKVVALLKSGLRGELPSDGDTQFSIADTLQEHVERVRGIDQAKVRNAFADMVGNAGAKVSWWDKHLGTQYAKAEKFPAYKRVFERVQQYIEDVSTLANQAADQAPLILPKLETWKDLRKSFQQFGLNKADAEAVAAPVFQGTLAWSRDEDGKPVREDDIGKAGIVWTDAELRERFDLKPEQIKAYRQFLNAVNTSLDQVVAADVLRLLGDKNPALRDLALADRQSMRTGIDEYLSEQIEAGDESAAELQQDIREKYARIDKLKAEGYAPLMRFGEYKVFVSDPETGESLFFGLYESKAEANRMARELATDPEFKGATIEQGVLSKEQYKLFNSVPVESLEMFAEAIGADQKEVFEAYLRLAKNNRSAMKRLISRKGTAGFSEDVPRVLASFVTSNARLASGAMNLTSAKSAINDIRDGDVKDEAIELVESVQNPKETAAAARSLMFMNFIGGSIASAAVNLTQPVTMTLPYLSQFGGLPKATARLMAAAKMAATGKVDDPELRAALEQAEKDGTVSPQEIHHLTAQAMGSWGNNAVSKRAAFIWGAPFSLAEQFNRRISFIAGYQTAKAEGMDDPFAFAERAVTETQGLYNKGNMPNLSRGAVGATAMQFKQFGIHYLEWMQRMWNAGEPGSDQRRAGRRAVLIALALLMMAAGTDGLPFAEDIDDLVDTIGQALGYNTNSKKARRDFIANTLGLGDETADAVARGLSALPGVPMDVSLRMGMGNLLPGTGLFLRSNTDRSRDLLEFAGPAGGMAKQYMDAAQKGLQGDVGGMLQGAVPVAAQNAMKALDMWQTGEARDTMGRKVMEADEVDGLMKFLGFNPSSIARESQKMGMIRRSEQLAKNVEGEIAGKWARAFADGDAAGVAEARAELAEWNQANPEERIAITSAQILQRVKKLRQSRAQRFITSVSPERRGSVEEALQ